MGNVWRHLPNAITLIRLLLLAPLTWLLIVENYVAAFVVFVIAGVSDGLDGFLARRYGWTSRFGATLDPAADKLLVTLTYGLLTWHGHLSWWLFVIVFGRDILIVIGYFAYLFFIGTPKMQPLLISKINTACQISLVSLVMMRLGTGVGWPVIELWGQWLVGALGIVSGAAYVWIWGQRACLAKSHVDRVKGSNNG